MSIPIFLAPMGLQQHVKDDYDTPILDTIAADSTVAVPQPKSRRVRQGYNNLYGCPHTHKVKARRAKNRAAKAARKRNRR